MTFPHDTAENLIRVLQEASGVVAIWKPAGLATQAPPGIPSAESWLRHRLHGESGRGYLGVPHRLDRGVSGVVLFAATPRAARKLSRQFEARQIRKSYLAIVTCGAMAGDAFATLTQAEAATWRDMVEKIPEESRARIVPPDEPGGREAVTLARFRCHLPDRRLLLELSPVTGRMHQLRIQAAARGLPIVGDDLYGTADETWAGPLPFGATTDVSADDPRRHPIALHARCIAYADPDTGSSVTVEAALPRYWPATQDGGDVP